MNYENYIDAPVFDQNGEKMGTIADLFYTDNEHQPVWATVKSGLFGMQRHFVPLDDAEETEDGVTIHNVTHEMVKNAPSIDDDDETSDEDDARLRNYYKYNNEAMNGRESDLSDVEPMPNVDIADRHESDTSDSNTQQDTGNTERRLLHRYIVQEGDRKWKADVVVEKTPLVDDSTSLPQ